MFFHYDRELFPAIIAETVDLYVNAGKAELVSLGHQLMMNLVAYDVLCTLLQQEGDLEWPCSTSSIMEQRLMRATLPRWMNRRLAPTSLVTRSCSPHE